jgi:hypothetical protein
MDMHLEDYVIIAFFSSWLAVFIFVVLKMFECLGT